MSYECKKAIVSLPYAKEGKANKPKKILNITYYLPMSFHKIYIASTLKRFNIYKDLGEKTFAQLSEAELYFRPNETSNSIAIIIQHMAGNMISRWTDFLTTDGEKENRGRDAEFEHGNLSKDELMDLWQRGWSCCLAAIQNLTEADLQATVYIRGEALTVIDAIQRQLAHYPYHVGQIIYIGKIIRDGDWKNLSMPKKS